MRSFAKIKSSRKFPNLQYKGNTPHVLTQHICLSIFEDNQLATISVKLFSILTIGFREDIIKFLILVHKGNWLRSLVGMCFCRIK